MENFNKSEEKIEEIVNFLIDNIDTSPFNQDDPIKCTRCLFRRIATLVLSKKIKISKTNFKNEIALGVEIDKEKNKQGSDWHNNYIEKLYTFLKAENIGVEKEPRMFFGRADLFIKEKDVYIEIGTINLYKLLCNIVNMKNCYIHILPNDKYLIEIKI